MTKRAAIRRLFEPQSVAVIGASGDPKKIGHSIVRNIIEGGYRGAVYPVNPRGEDILGLKTYRSIEGNQRCYRLGDGGHPSKGRGLRHSKLRRQGG